MNSYGKGISEIHVQWSKNHLFLRLILFSYMAIHKQFLFIEMPDFKGINLCVHESFPVKQLFYF